jgi:hypothetical protein
MNMYNVVCLKTKSGLEAFGPFGTIIVTNLSA